MKGKKDLCNALCSFRKMQGLDIDAAAKKLKVSVTALSAIENGSINFSFDLLLRISEVYKFEIVFEEI